MRRCLIVCPKARKQRDRLCFMKRERQRSRDGGDDDDEDDDVQTGSPAASGAVLSPSHPWRNDELWGS